MTRHHPPFRRRAVVPTARTRTAFVTATALIASALTMAPALAAPSQVPAGSDANYSSGQSAPVTPETPAPADMPRLDDGFGPSAEQQQAMRTAAAQATTTGKAVVVNALTTPEQQITASPSGGFELTSNPEPVRTQQHGSWRQISTTLHRGSNGSITPEATAYGTVSFSGGGNTPLVVSHYDGVTMTVRWPSSLPAPQVDGSTATYHDVLPSVDLVVAATGQRRLQRHTRRQIRCRGEKPGTLPHCTCATTVPGGTLPRTPATTLTVRDSTGRDLMTAARPADVGLQQDSCPRQRNLPVHNSLRTRPTPRTPGWPPASHPSPPAATSVGALPQAGPAPARRDVHRLAGLHRPDLQLAPLRPGGPRLRRGRSRAAPASPSPTKPASPRRQRQSRRRLQRLAGGRLPHR